MPGTMDGRCSVEIWAEFGFFVPSCNPKIKFVSGTCVFLSTGSNEVYLFCTKKRELTGVLQLPGPVNDIVGSHDNKFLFVACQSGVYCVNVQPILSRAQSSLDDASLSPAEMQIASELLVVPEEGILSLFFEGSILVTVSHRDSSWVLTLYRSLKQLKPSSFEMLGSFSLPVIPGVSHSDSERKTRTRRRPVLMCVYCSDALSSSPSSSSNNSFFLDHVLFKLLFGIDAALAKSPVVLCGLPDGRLCFLPLRPSGSGLRVLHSLEQPVIFMGASSVEESSGHPRCLVAVGEEGRMILMEVNKGGPEGGGCTAGFTEGCVPGPVVCGCVEKNCLYYSTVTDLLALDMSGLCGRPKEEKTSNMTVTALQNITSLNVCRVIALAHPTRDTAGEYELLALSERGMLQRITMPARGRDATSSNVPSTHSGRSIRELLSAIGDVCERASALKSDIKSKNQILTHLNQVLNISYLLTASTNSDQLLPIQEKPIRCHATTNWSRLLQKDTLNLICVLENPSPYVLEKGWTLSITVSALSYPPSMGGERSSTNFAFPFQNLHPGESLEVSLPLSAAADTSFPVTVSCSLVHSLSSLLGEEAGKLPDLQTRCISLPLNTLTVDWLHALQVDCPKATRATAQSDNTVGTIQAFINSHQLRCRGKREGGGESALKSAAEKYSAAVRVSSELLKETLWSKHSDVDPHPNMSHSLLDWLLSESYGGVKREQHRNRTTTGSSVIQARGPDGHFVKLTTKEVKEEDNLRKEDSLTTVEVMIESSSLAAVCGLHHALLCRVQTLVQRAPDGASSKKSIQTQALRETLHRAENLLQLIQQSRISEGFGAVVSGGHTTRSPLHVYRDLRENPLLII